MMRMSELSISELPRRFICSIHYVAGLAPGRRRLGTNNHNFDTLVLRAPPPLFLLILVEIAGSTNF